jgi:hypothetical protein
VVGGQDVDGDGELVGAGLLELTDAVAELTADVEVDGDLVGVVDDALDVVVAPVDWLPGEMVGCAVVGANFAVPGELWRGRSWGGDMGPRLGAAMRAMTTATTPANATVPLAMAVAVAA